MDGHHAEVIGIVLLLVFAATMFYQGTMIMRQHHGYSQRYIKRDAVHKYNWQHWEPFDKKHKL
jgi:hypothetical protein